MTIAITNVEPWSNDALGVGCDHGLGDGEAWPVRLRWVRVERRWRGECSTCRAVLTATVVVTADLASAVEDTEDPGRGRLP